MRAFAIFIAMGCLLAASVQADYTLEDLETFVIDLDLAPEERFKEVAEYYSEPIQYLVEYYLKLMPAFVEDIFAKLEPFMKTLQHEHYLEVKGIADTLGLPMSQALYLNYIYELQAYCTSTIVRQADGTIMHSRNLDFPNSDQMRDITYKAEFKKNGETLFHAVQFAGTIGLYTGMKEGAFSVSENDRQTKITVAKILDNLELMFKGYNEVSWLVRDVLETCEDYECAMNNFITQPIITPAYLIVAGVEKYEGAIISRTKTGAEHIEMLSEDRWYVFQTNDDHYNGECQGRCQTVLTNLEEFGQQELDKETFRSEIMYKSPTLNDHTIFNSLMIPKEGFMDSIGTDCDYPDEP